MADGTPLRLPNRLLVQGMAAKTIARLSRCALVQLLSKLWTSENFDPCDLLVRDLYASDAPDRRDDPLTLVRMRS